MLKIILLFLLGFSLVLSNPVLKDDIQYRLPEDKIVEPTAYEITITPSIPTENGVKISKFQGIVIISATIKKPKTNEIKLHANKGITFKEKDVEVVGDDASSTKYPVTLIRDENDPTEFFTLKSDTEIPANTNVKITIVYEGKMDDNMYGFYLSSYQEGTNKQQKYIGSTQMESLHARKAFPCFDEPSYKATFKITIVAPKGFNVLSNMEVDKINQVEEKSEYVFKQSPKMSTYLVAFVVSEFEPFTSDKKFNVWARKDAKAQTEFAQQIGPETLKHLGIYNGINFQDMGDTNKMVKMDLVAIPDFAAGAMENWGLLTYRETALLYDPKYSTMHDKLRVAAVIAHEQGHQWFGDYVTLAWWENTWLNEGFATYFEYHALARMENTQGILDKCVAEPTNDCWDMKNQFVIDEHQTALAADSLSSATEALQMTVNTLSEIEGHFGTISYNKGGSIIRMMEHFLESYKPDLFKNSLQHYLETNKYSNTKPDHLFTAMDDKIAEAKIEIIKDKKMKEIMDKWITEPGYPLITVTDKTNEDNEKVWELKQKRFFLSSSNNKQDTFNWTVPITYASTIDELAVQPKPIWLEDETLTIKIPDDADWILLNLNSAGYYRVKYPKHILDKIYQILSRHDTHNNVKPIDKAQLVDDVLNLARANEYKYEDALGFLEFLRKEDNYYPWASAFTGLRFLMQRYSDTDKEGGKIRSEILNIMKETLLKDVSLKPEATSTAAAAEDNVIDIFNKVNALQWACDLGDVNCTTDATSLFEEWTDPTKDNPIPVDYRPIVYCTALKGEKDKTKEGEEFTPYFKKLWDQYSASNYAAEKITILNALGCTKNKDNINNYLLSSLDSNKVRKQDANYVFTSVYTGNTAGVDLALAFLTAEGNWEKISTSYGGMGAINKVVSGLADRLTTQDQINKLSKLMDDHIGSGEAQLLPETVNTVKETMTANKKWSDARRKEIVNFICTTVDPKYEGCKKKGDGAASFTGSVTMILLGIVAVYLK